MKTQTIGPLATFHGANKQFWVERVARRLDEYTVNSYRAHTVGRGLFPLHNYGSWSVFEDAEAQAKRLAAEDKTLALLTGG